MKEDLSTSVDDLVSWFMMNREFIDKDFIFFIHKKIPLNQMKKLFLSLQIWFEGFMERNVTLATFLLTIASIYFLDLFFFHFSNMLNLGESDFILTFLQSGGVDYAPEVWLGLLSLVLGTLIIVISIASQSTPKLIDLYISDKKSLFYIWFLTIGSAHNIMLQLFFTSSCVRYSSTILNTYLLMPVAVLLAIPYIIYILKYTKPSNVIDKIFFNNVLLIGRIEKMSKFPDFYSADMMDGFKYRLFETLNQLDDLLEYVSFKEPKADIINNISRSVQQYLVIKNRLPEKFFRISDCIRSDISFKTMSTQLEEIERTKVFYEQKAFRLMGNAYFKLIENNDFDLASLCVFEMSQCAKVAIDTGDEATIGVLIVRFNTVLRFGIKHGLKNSEVRNLYNSLFHYSEFINYQVEKKQVKFIKTSCNYLKIYGTEIYKHSRQNSSFSFLVDVFAYELKKILIRLNELEYAPEFQHDILGLFLEMDNPPDVDRDDLGQWRIMNDGVRVLQVGLALYYLTHKKENMVQRIIDDIMEDYSVLKDKFIIAIESTCNKLRIYGPTFWEDTDRGNTNIYFSEHKDQIDRFLEMFHNKFSHNK